MTQDELIESLQQQLAECQKERDEWRDKACTIPEATGAYAFAIDQATKFQKELLECQAREAKLREALIKCSEQLTRLGYSANHTDEALVLAVNDNAMIVNALRLAVQFDIVPRCINGVAFAWKDGLCDIQVPYTTDPYTAICKAIVQAACMAIEKENGI